MDNKTTRILRLILFLSGAYPKTKDECKSYLDICESSFFNYCSLLKEIGFEINQKEGRYWISKEEHDSNILSKLLYFTEEEGYILANAISQINDQHHEALTLKKKLHLFLNHDEAVNAYIRKNKKEIVCELLKAKRDKRQVILINYSSGNSQNIKNRQIEPFEFKDDFNLIWGFDVEIGKNRQFKISRIESLQATNFSWVYEYRHRSLPVDVFRNTGELNKRVKFEMNLRAKNLLIEEYPLAEEHIIQISQNKYLFETQVAKYEGPGRFVLGMPEDNVVIDDKAFIDYLKEKVNHIKNKFLQTTKRGVV